MSETPRVRTRPLPGQTLISEDSGYLTPREGEEINWDTAFGTTEKFSWPGHEVTVDVNHGSDFRKRGHSLSDVGDDFFNEKVFAKLNVRKVRVLNAEIGPFTRSLSSFATPNIQLTDGWLMPPDIGSDPDALEEVGATAIARCEPTNPLAQGSVAAGEMFGEHGIPSIPIIHTFKKRAQILKQAGSEFLNVGFGWLPLVNDVKSLSHGVVNFDQLMQKYENQSGKPHRAHYEFPPETNVTENVSDNQRILIGFGEGLGFSHDTGERGQVLARLVTTRRRSFSGSFTYYLPTDYESRRGTKAHIASAKKILGVELTPETLWNLAPWTWAADWVSNAGDVVHNASAFASNGLVMHYGYMTERTSSVLTVQHVGPTGSSLVGNVPPMSFHRETHRRIRANPYGFGVSWDGLSTFQQAVLVSLGLSRRR